jgi:DNA-binding CsgD family transcriptional regulator/PAS domain-containing protein
VRVDEALYHRLIGAIYDAALEPDLWQDALRLTSDAMSAVGTLYLSYDLRFPERSQHVLGRLDPDLTRSYLIRYSKSSPWARMRSLMPVGQVVSVDAYVRAAELVRSEFYRDILHPQGILHCGAACLARDSERFVGFSIFRSAKAGPTEGTELRILSALAPHIRRATQITWRLGAASAFKRAEGNALDRIDHGVILLDAGGQVLFANRAAEAILALNDGLTAVGKAIRAATPADTRRLEGLIAEAAKGAPGGTMRLARPSLAEPFLVLVAPAAARGPWPVETVPASMVFVTDCDRPPRLDIRRLAELFGLTPTEAKVALALARGDGVPQTSRALRLSRNTVHTHMQRIFRKLGVNRQSELVRVLTRIAALVPDVSAR